MLFIHLGIFHVQKSDLPVRMSHFVHYDVPHKLKPAVVKQDDISVPKLKHVLFRSDNFLLVLCVTV